MVAEAAETFVREIGELVRRQPPAVWLGVVGVGVGLVLLAERR